jgi:phage shock protein A
MKIITRIRGVVTANLHDLVDEFEEPEVMLRQAIREMEESLAEATGAAAKAIASETLLAQQLDEHERLAGRWQASAEEAIATGDDDLARKALARKLDHVKYARDVRESLAAASEAALSLRRQVEAMRAKRSEARRRLATLTAHRKAAEARQAIQGQTPSPPRGFARFEQLRERVEQAEAEARALVDLADDCATDQDAELAAREEKRQIEAELAAIKTRSK